jgi:hypothetical protein
MIKDDVFILIFFTSGRRKPGKDICCCNLLATFQGLFLMPCNNILILPNVCSLVSNSRRTPCQPVVLPTTVQATHELEKCIIVVSDCSKLNKLQFAHGDRFLLDRDPEPRFNEMSSG